MKKLLLSFALCLGALNFVYAQHEHHDHDSHNHSHNINLDFIKSANFFLTGSVLAAMTDDEHSEDRNKPVFDLGELELSANIDFSKYARAAFVVGVHSQTHHHDADGGHEHDETHVELEEAYVEFYKDLALEHLSLKAGKSRANFGRLNVYHTHELPFIEMPRVITQFLPEVCGGYIDTGFGAAYDLPMLFKGNSNLSFNILSGKDFDENSESKTNYAYLARLNNVFKIAGEHNFELGLSWLHSVNSDEYDKNTRLYGADIMTTLHFSPSIALTLQGEAFYSDGTSVEVIDNAPLPNDVYFHSNNRYGFYALANAQIGKKFNIGAIYDRYNRYNEKNATDKAVKGFIGYKLIDEITFRLTYEYFMPHAEANVNTAAFQILLALGNKRAHHNHAR